ncbi:MAG: hypothetical protein RBQ97_10215, partial [Acholeplasma sp.]|nr:hypothetical protein [Acholeplasma sp.]
NLIVVEELQYKTHAELFKVQKAYQDIKEEITYNLQISFNRFLDIGKNLLEIKKCAYYLIDGYKDIYEFALQTFGFSETVVKNYIGLYQTFSDKREIANQGFTISQLIELKSVPEDIDQFNASMTVQEIRTKKKDNVFLKTLSKKEKEVVIFFDFAKQFIDQELGKNDIPFDVTYTKTDSDNDFKPCLTYRVYKFQFSLKYTCTHYASDDLNFDCQPYVSNFYRFLSLDKDIFSQHFLEGKNSKPSILSIVLKIRDEYLEEQKAKLEKKEKVKAIVDSEKKNINEEDPLYLLKNNDERADFVRDAKNWILIHEALGIKFFKFKYLDFGCYEYQNGNFNTVQYYHVKNEMHHISYHASTGEIVNAIRDYRQSIFS